MDVQRALILIALAFVLMLIYQRWLQEQQPVPTAQTATPVTNQAVPPADKTVPPAASPPSGGATSAAQPAPSSEIPAAPVAPAGTSGAVPALPSAKTTPVLPTEQRVVVTTDLFRAEIDTHGGGLRDVRLLKYPVSVSHKDQPFPLLHETPEDVFVTQSGLIAEGRILPTHKTIYRPEALSYTLSSGADEVSARLSWDAPDGVRYTKVFRFHRNSYEIRVDFEVDNRSSEPWRGHLYAQFLRTPVEVHRGFFLDVVPSYTGGVIYTPEGKFEKIKFSDMKETNLARDVDSGWVGMMQHYFVGGWFPRAPGKMRFYSQAQDDGARFNLGLLSITPTEIAPSQKGELGVNLYIGPKEQDRLKGTAEGFNLTVDYGWLTFIAAPLFIVLRFIHGVVGNWGWAIVLLTVLIKLLFYPLSAASYKSMAKMKRLQPRMQTLKERYADDKTKFNQAMMELYKKEKVNPMGGCLPIAIQIPVFIALYWVLLESVELRQSPWILWIADLSVKDPYFVLPILMGGSMLAQHFLNPAPLDPMQKKIMMAMPIAFTFLFLYFPAGLVLYWLVNNVLSITQQWYINKQHAVT